MAIATVLASHSAPRRGAASSAVRGVQLGGDADQVGEDGDGLEIADRGEQADALRVEVVAGEQRQVGVRRLEQARSAVVEEVALAHALDDAAVELALRRGPGPGGEQLGERRADARRAAHEAADQQALAGELGGEGVENAARFPGLALRCGRFVHGRAA